MSEFFFFLLLVANLHFCYYDFINHFVLCMNFSGFIFLSLLVHSLSEMLHTCRISFTPVLFAPRVIVYVCTRLNVGLELKGHSPVCSLNRSGAGSLRAQTSAHPPSHPSFPHSSLSSSSLTPGFPTYQLFPFAQTGISMHLSSVIKNSSSLPPALCWIGTVQVSLSRGPTPHK